MDLLVLLTFILAPTYVLKFSLTNALMVWIFLFWVFFLVWLKKHNLLKKNFKSFKDLNKKILLWLGLLAASSAVSLFIQGVTRAKLGQLIVLFLQPLVTFFIVSFINKHSPKLNRSLLTTCYLLLSVAGFLALVQYFTLIGLPSEFWGNSQEPKRAVAFFIHPNFYALWSAPLLAFLLPDLKNKLDEKRFSFFLIWGIGAIGLFLSLSRAGWFGLLTALVIYLIFAADNKIRKILFGSILIMSLVIVAVPNFRYRLILPFLGEKSADSRIELWQSGIKAIKQSPVFGIGLNGYANEYRELQTDPSLPDHNFPHNIFLDFWVETGLTGLISFVAICYLTISAGFKNRQDIYKLGACLFIIALLTQGQIDNPYFKNDLAMIFWIILAFAN